MAENLLPERKKFDGDRVKIEEVLGKEIVVLDWFVAPSTIPGQTDKEYAVVNIVLGGKKAVLLTSSGVLMGVLKGIAKDGKPMSEHRPFKTKISEVAGGKGFNYYQFDYAEPTEKVSQEEELSEGGEKVKEDEIPF